MVTAEPTPEPSPWATGVNAHKGGPDLAQGQAAPAPRRAHGSGLTLTYLVKSQVPVLVKTGEILREQLKKVGITLDVRPLESGQYFEELVGKKFDIAGGVVERHRRPRHVLLPDAALLLGLELLRLQVGGGATSGSTPSASPRTRPRARRCTRSWCAGSRRRARSIVFSNEIQRYWMKPNVQGSVPLSSLELRFEDTWLS